MLPPPKREEARLLNILRGEITSLKEEWQALLAEPEKKGYIRIAESADFEDLYIAIAKMVQKEGKTVKPSEMVKVYKEEYGDHWLKERYPSDMEAKKMGEVS